MSELKSRESRACPECGGRSLSQTTTRSNGPYGPALLPALGGFFSFPRFRVVVCADCGLTRFYAEPLARAQLSQNRRWQHL